MGNESIEQQVARLDERLAGALQAEASCRELNHAEHNELYRRVNALERNMALMNLRMTMWAAVGSVLGGGALNLLIWLLTQRAAVP